MKKRDRVRDLICETGGDLPPDFAIGVSECGPEVLKARFDPRYLGYFTCFNSARYYDAHDVLEDLWLSQPGPDSAFYKGLIQLAGAFVHLQKQRARPDHPKDGRRLAPAARLFSLAERNLSPFSPFHHGLDLCAILVLARRHVADIEASNFSVNPWHPDHAPHLTLR